MTAIMNQTDRALYRIIFYDAVLQNPHVRVMEIHDGGEDKKNTWCLARLADAQYYHDLCFINRLSKNFSHICQGALLSLTVYSVDGIGVNKKCTNMKL